MVDRPKLPDVDFSDIEARMLAHYANPINALREIAEYKDTFGGPPADDAMREIARTALASLNATPGAAVCATCNGHGLIGGFEHNAGAPGYVVEPCPDCALPVPTGELADDVADVVERMADCKCISPEDYETLSLVPTALRNAAQPEAMPGREPTHWAYEQAMWHGTSYKFVGWRWFTTSQYPTGPNTRNITPLYAGPPEPPANA